MDSSKNEPSNRKYSDLSDVKLNKSGLISNPKFHTSILVLFVVVMFYFLNYGRANNNADREKKKIVNKIDYSAELEANKAKLEQEKSKLIKAIEPILKESKEAESKIIMDKEYIMRMNQPVGMYSDDINRRQKKQLKGGLQEAIFAGETGFDEFGNKKVEVQVEEAKKMPHPEYTVASGEFMHATLDTAISSDFPGLLRATVTQPVYGYVGQTELVPAGSRLIGQYLSTVKKGQTRIMVVWNRVILPNGMSILVNSPGGDNLGRAGQTANSIDKHFIEKFSHATLLSVIGAGVANYHVSSSDEYNSKAQYRMSIADGFQQSANSSIKENNNIKNTIHVYQGSKVNVFIARDISFFNVLTKQS